MSNPNPTLIKAYAKLLLKRLEEKKAAEKTETPKSKETKDNG